MGLIIYLQRITKMMKFSSENQTSKNHSKKGFELELQHFARFHNNFYFIYACSGEAGFWNCLEDKIKLFRHFVGPTGGCLPLHTCKGPAWGWTYTGP